jgi:hypothetical protein
MNVEQRDPKNQQIAAANNSQLVLRLIYRLEKARAPASHLHL